MGIDPEGGFLEPDLPLRLDPSDIRPDTEVRPYNARPDRRRKTRRVSTQSATERLIGVSSR